MEHKSLCVTVLPQFCCRKETFFSVSTLWALWSESLHESADFPSICGLWTFTVSPIYTWLASASSPITPGKLFVPSVCCIWCRKQGLRLTGVCNPPVCPHIWGPLIALWPERSDTLTSITKGVYLFIWLLFVTNLAVTLWPVLYILGQKLQEF